MENKNTAKTVVSVTLITLFSRLLTLLSTQLYIGTYGTTALNEYTYALNIPNVIFTCIGTLLTTIIVPIYSSLLDKKEEGSGKGKEKEFLDNIISISMLLILLLVVVCYLIAPVFFYSKDYGEQVEKLKQGIFYLRIFFPLMFFYGLNFIFQGILQSHGKFKLPAAVAVPSSFVVILYVVFLGNKYGITGLVYATFIGLALQAVVLLPAVIRTGYRFSFRFDFKSPEIVACRKLVGPVLIAVSAYQINTLFNSYMALQIDQNTVLSYVYNLIIVSILSFVYSITAVYYPLLSVLWSKGDKLSYKDKLCEVMNVIIFFLVPATFGFILVRFQLFDLLMKWGKVTAENVTTCGNILGLYALGILALGFKEIMDRAFYAQNNTKVSAVMGFVIMGCNVMFCLLLIDKMGIYAMPLSYSISSTIGVSGLIFVMRKKIGGLKRSMLTSAVKCLLSALAMSVVIYFEIKMLQNYFGDGILGRAVKLFVPAGTGAVIYFVSAYLLGIEQVRTVLDKVKKKRVII